MAFYNIPDDSDSETALFQVNGRSVHSHKLFTILSNIFPSDYVRAKDSRHWSTDSFDDLSL